MNTTPQCYCLLPAGTALSWHQAQLLFRYHPLLRYMLRLETVNLDQVLLHKALLSQELQDVLALIALQLDDLA